MHAAPYLVALVAALISASEIALDTDYLTLVGEPLRGTVTTLSLKALPGNQAAESGLIQEGFGVSSPYVPGRRINEVSELTSDAAGKFWRFAYDCQGPNIDGLHVTRLVEAVPGQASLRVRWRVENKGTARQWMAPWVRNDIQASGVFDTGDRVELPALAGITTIQRTGYQPLSRNWAAVTDANAALSVCSVYQADKLHSALGILEQDAKLCGHQAAFVPRLMAPGDMWETTYRINVLRGLKHVDFASQEIGAQLDYIPGKLQVLIATVKPMQNVQIHASVVAENGRRWKLAPKKFNIDPNRVIRCTFDWTAQGDGVYEFLAQLRGADGKPLELNSELKAPHGGIDTQFIVGAPKNRHMEAWSDAPYALERGSRKHPRPVARLGNALVWVEDALEKVYPNDEAEPQAGASPAIRIALAQNERESFQLVVRPQKDAQLHKVNYATTGFGPIKPENLQAYNVRCYPVQIPSHFEGPTGDCPDPLPAFKPFTASPGRSIPIWFTLHAPSGTPAGVHRGEITLTAADQKPLKIPVEVTVFNFALPVTPALRTDFYFWPDKAVEAAKKYGTKLTEQEVVKRYVTDALAHRVTLRLPNDFPAPSGAYAADLAKRLPHIKDLAARGATTLAVPHTLLATPEQLQAADKFVTQNKLENLVFCPFADNPKPEQWQELVEKLKLWRQHAPHIPVMVTTFGLQPILLDGVDIWDVHSQVLDTINNKPILERIAQGREVWWFLAQGPARPYANFFIDYAGIEHRMFFWQTWALGLRGVHYWGVNYAEPGQDPYLSQLDATPVNGDGCLLYPGPNGPVDSIRWETIRDGIEDYDYLAMLTKGLQRLRDIQKNSPLAEQAAQLLNLKELAPDLVSFTREPQKLQARRIAIARMIEQINKTLAGK